MKFILIIRNELQMSVNKNFLIKHTLNIWEYVITTLITITLTHAGKTLLVELTAAKRVHSRSTCVSAAHDID